MGYKTISVSDEVYTKLASLKHPGESFNEFFVRVAEKQTVDLKKFFGAWKMSDREEKAMKKDLRKIWGAWDESLRQ